MTDRELMQQALEALEIAEVDGNCYYKATKLLRARLAQPEQEHVAWRNAAIRVGEELSSVGPDGYYNMTAQQWLDWAMEQQPVGKNSLAQPEQEPHRQWRGLTEEDIAEIAEKLGLADVAWVDLMQAIERRLKRRNT